MSLQRRLARLEGQRPDAACPACGWDPDAPVTFDIVTDEEGSPFYRETVLPEPEPCLVCGRAPRVFTITIEYGGDDEELDR